MKGAYILWLPLLEPLNIAVEGFIEHLISSVLDILKAATLDTTFSEENSIAWPPVLSSPTPALAPEDKEFNRALVAWVKQLTGKHSIHKLSKAGPIGNASFDLDSVAKQCIFCPNEWYNLTFSPKCPNHANNVH